MFHDPATSISCFGTFSSVLFVYAKNACFQLCCNLCNQLQVHLHPLDGKEAIRVLLFPDAVQEDWKVVVVIELIHINLVPSSTPRDFSPSTRGFFFLLFFLTLRAFSIVSDILLNLTYVQITVSVMHEKCINAFSYTQNARVRVYAYLKIMFSVCHTKTSDLKRTNEGSGKLHRVYLIFPKTLDFFRDGQ